MLFRQWSKNHTELVIRLEFVYSGLSLLKIVNNERGVKILYTLKGH